MAERGPGLLIAAKRDRFARGVILAAQPKPSADPTRGPALYALVLSTLPLAFAPFAPAPQVDAW